MISTKYDFNNKNIRILSIDFEMRKITKGNITRNQIFAAGFYSNTGFSEAIHLEDEKFKNDEVIFIRHIVYRIQSFSGTISGWYLANSDLVTLDEVCKCIGVRSPVEFYEVSVNTTNNDSDNNDLDGNDDHICSTEDTQVIKIQLQLRLAGQ